MYVAKVIRVAVFQAPFRDELRYWVQNDRKLAMRTLDLVDAVLREPYSGIGKPEPLKQLGSDVWSRRIDHQNRLVYVVYRDHIDFLQCRYHY